MKKNIWTNVYYRLNDPAMIRFAILYTIRYVGFPMSAMDLKHVLLDATRVDYFDLCETIEKLKEENHLKVVIRDEIEMLDMTESGTETIEMFEKDLLYSVRQSIKKSADKFFKEEFAKESVRTAITPIDANTFYFDAQLNEGRTKLFSVSVFAGSKENAAKMREKFTKNPTGFFQEILKFLKDDSEE